MKKENSYDLLAEIEANNSGERGAMDGYYRLIAECARLYDEHVLGKELYEEIKADIEEIIADELNHSNKLTALVEKLSGIMPAKN